VVVVVVVVIVIVFVVVVVVVVVVVSSLPISVSVNCPRFLLKTLKTVQPPPYRCTTTPSIRTQKTISTTAWQCSSNSFVWKYTDSF